MRCLSRVSIHEVRILDMPSPRRAATKLRKVTLSKAPTISRKIPKAGFFLTRQCSTRRTNSCRAVSVETPARNPYCDAVSFACTLLSSLKAVNHPANSGGLQWLKLNYNFWYFLFWFWSSVCKDIQQIQKSIPRKKFLETLSFDLPAKTTVL